METKIDNKTKQKLTFSQAEDLKKNIAPCQPAEEKKVNKDFTQLYLNSHDYLIQLISKNPTAAKIFLLMMKYCEANNTVYLPVESIMQAINTKRKQTVTDGIKILQDEGYIAIYKYGKNNFYFINPNLTCNCDVRYKKKLLETYESIDKEELAEIDLNIVNTTKISKDDGIKLKIGFYKTHEELQKPTEEEIQAQKDKEEILDNDGQKFLDMEQKNKKLKKEKEKEKETAKQKNISKKKQKD